MKRIKIGDGALKATENNYPQQAGRYQIPPPAPKAQGSSFWRCAIGLLLVLVLVLGVLVVKKRSRGQRPQRAAGVTKTAVVPTPILAQSAKKTASVPATVMRTEQEEKSVEPLNLEVTQPQKETPVPEKQDNLPLQKAESEKPKADAGEIMSDVSAQGLTLMVDDAPETTPEDVTDTVPDAEPEGEEKTELEDKPENNERTDVAESLNVLEDGHSVAYDPMMTERIQLEQDEKGMTVNLPHGQMLRLIKIPAGSFTMGSDDNDDGRGLHEDEHKVSLTDDFWLGSHEITRSAWKAVMGCVTKEREESDDTPMVCVNRTEALAFCSVLNDWYGPKLPGGYVFCLPTSAQWEYAVRGGMEGKAFRFAGGDLLDEVGWHAGNSQNRLHPVGARKPNELGLYDMSGNAMEYCLDNTSNIEQEENPIGEIWGERFGVRGGAFCSTEWQCRVSSLSLFQGRQGRYGTVGFRVALVPRREFTVEEEDISSKGKGSQEDLDEEDEEDEEEKKTEDEEEKEKAKKPSRYSKPLLTTRHDPLDHKSTETIDLKKLKLLHTREDFENRDEEEEDEEDEEEEGQEKGKKGRKKRRRAPLALLKTRFDSLKHENANTMNLKAGRLLQTRDEAENPEEELEEQDEEETTKDEKEQGKGKNKKEEKKKRRPRRPLLRTRHDSLEHVNAETIDMKGRKLLQTREQVVEAREKKRREKEREEAKKDQLGLQKGIANIDLGEKAVLVMIKVNLERMTLGSKEDETERRNDEIRRKTRQEGTIWISKTEVTQNAYWAIMKQNPSLIRGNGQRPVENVTWENARDFCLNLNEKFKDKLPKGIVFRLPTENEWEYCSRGGQKGKGKRYSGSDQLEKVGWHVGNSKGTTQMVGALKPNELGLLDMSGNVAEWCLDSCARNERSEVKGARGKTSEALPYRVRKGGAWCFSPSRARSAARGCSLPDFRSPYVGFRVVLGPEVKR